MEGALPPSLRALAQDAHVELLGDGVSGGGSAAAWEIRDLNLKRTDPPAHLQDYRGTAHFERIREVLGFARHREAIRVDMAQGAGCVLFVTDNPDVLRRRKDLEALLPIRFLHPLRDIGEIRRVVTSAQQ